MAAATRYFINAGRALPSRFYLYSASYIQKELFLFNRKYINVCTGRNSNSQVVREPDSPSFRHPPRGKCLPAVLLGAAGLLGLTKKKEESEKGGADKQAQANVRNSDAEVVMAIKRAKLAEMKEDYDEASNHYHQALSLLTIYQQNKTWDMERLVQARVFVFDGMANMAMATGHYGNAEKLFKESMKGLIQLNMPKDDDSIVDISLKLAIIYAIQHRNEEAARGYQFCIETQEKKIKDAQGLSQELDSNRLALLGLACDSYSKFLLQQSRVKEAGQYLEKALGIAQQVFEEDHPQMAVLLNDLATIKDLQGDHKAAKEILAKAIKIGEEAHNLDLSAFYCNMASICLHKAEVTEAEQNCSKALKFAKAHKDITAQNLAKECMDNVKKHKA